jgi:lipoprotein LpqH
MLLAALVGCSSTHTATSAPSTAVAPGSAAPNPAAVTNPAPGQAHVLIGGKDASPGGTVACSTDSGLTTITIGEGAKGATIVLTDAATPVVKSVGIGDIGGVSMGYFEGQPGTPPHTVRAGSTYTVTGSGTTDPTSDVQTTYQISATCP